jgi:hypothetical protein
MLVEQGGGRTAAGEVSQMRKAKVPRSRGALAHGAQREGAGAVAVLSLSIRAPGAEGRMISLSSLMSGGGAMEEGQEGYGARQRQDSVGRVPLQRWAEESHMAMHAGDPVR